MDTRIAFGTEIKTLSDDGETMRIGAHLVLFGSPEEHDLYPNRDYFTKNTDFGLVEGKGVAPVLYHHGLNPVLGNRKLATAALSLTDDGVWMETELKARDAYESRVMQLVRAGKLGTSSGAWKKDIERVAVVNKNGDTCHEIKKWHLGMDASLTPTPADPRTLAMEMKSLEEVEGWADELGEEDAEFKGSRGWQTQPRDDNGQWSGGADSSHSSEKPAPAKSFKVLPEEDYRAEVQKIAEEVFKGEPELLKHHLSVASRVSGPRYTNAGEAQANIEQSLKLLKAHRDYQARKPGAEIKSETESPETQAPELKSFADHRDEALDAIDGFITRAGEIKALRESRKSGAPVSAAMRDNLTAAAERLMELKATIESILTEADVEAKSDTTETDAAPATATDDAPADAEAVDAAWDAFIAHHVKAAGI